MQKAKRQRVVFSQDIKHLASKENSSIEGASPTPPTFDFCLFSQQLLWSVKKKQRAIRVPKERQTGFIGLLKCVIPAISL